MIFEASVDVSDDNMHSDIYRVKKLKLKVIHLKVVHKSCVVTEENNWG